MGAYLSEPNTEKISEEDENEFVKYGASAMQGWRTSQEDAHIGLLDFDEKTSVFAVFDGHGGGEVAKYCALHLPQFLKNLKHYKNDDLKRALEEAFLGFDRRLILPEVVAELKVIAGDDYIRSDEDEEDANEASLLKEEANLPLEALIARYRGSENDPDEVMKRDIIPPHLRLEVNAKRIKPVSPFLRSKQGPSTHTTQEDEETELINNLCSSSSSTSDESQRRALNRLEVCSSSSSTSGLSSFSHNLPNGKLNESDPEINSFSLQLPDGGDSVSSSVNEVNEDRNDTCKVSSTKSDSSKCISNLVSESNEVAPGESSNSSSSGEQESNKQPNGETSAQNEKDSCVSTSSEAAPAKSSKLEQLSSSSSSSILPSPSSAASDNTVSTAASTSVDEPSSSSKGKGKKKKVVIQENVKSDSTTRSARIDYKAILSEDLDKDNEYLDDDSDSSDMEYGGDDNDDDDDDEEEEEDDDDEDDDDDDDDDEIGVSFEASSSDFEVPGRDSGCTAVFAVLKGNQLYVANAGDSRCVLSRKGRAMDMSLDHKPEDTIEKNRIEAAGGSINTDGRINGGLNLSRAIGDHTYKTNSQLSLKDQMITAFPDIRTAIIKPDRDEFMVLACDGIWNSMSSQEVVDFVKERIDGKRKLSSICEELFDHCLSPDTDGDGTGCDNMTCIIVQFNNVKPTDSQKEFEDSDDEAICKTSEEQQAHPSQSDSKKQPAPESQEGTSSEPVTKKQKTDL